MATYLESQLERRLFDLGYLTKIHGPITDFTPWENRQPTKVEGKSVSQIVIEERDGY